MKGIVIDLKREAGVLSSEIEYVRCVRYLENVVRAAGLERAEPKHLWGIGFIGTPIIVGGKYRVVLNTNPSWFL
jgi:hypothetical protein